MLKKLLTFFLLIISITSQATLLKDGSSVPRKKVDQVYYALMSVYHSNDGNKQVLLADLLKSCKDNNRKLELSAVYNIARMGFEEDYKKRLDMPLI